MFQEVEKIWSDGSEDYDKVVHYQLSRKKDVQHWLNALSSALGGKTGLDVMDVGCGPGFFSIMLLRLGESVTSVDGAEGMVQCAKRNIRAAGYRDNVRLSDAVLLPGENRESYDAIVSRDVVWTLYDPETAFAQWAELLRPGGRIVIYDGNYYYEAGSVKRTLWRWLANVLIFFTEHRVRVQKKTVLSEQPMCKCKRPEKDVELLERVGLKIVSAERDDYRCSGLLHLKYGWQADPFYIIAEKPPA